MAADYEREAKSALSSSSVGRYNAAPIVPKKLDFYGTTKQQQDFEYERVVRQATNHHHKARESNLSSSSTSGFYEPISKHQQDLTASMYTPERTRPSYNVDSDFSSTRKQTTAASNNYLQP